MRPNAFIFTAGRSCRRRRDRGGGQRHETGFEMSYVDALYAEIRACDACQNLLSLGARPVFQASRTARILIASQAPGSKVHASGVPFSDPSGDRLRGWMGLSPRQFYDSRIVAIVPMGLCYPG